MERGNITANNILQAIQQGVNKALTDFKSSVCEECNWYEVKYNRKLKSIDEENDQFNPPITKEEQGKIIKAWDYHWQQLHDYLGRYRESH
jgi:hypothetical protein